MYMWLKDSKSTDVSKSITQNEHLSRVLEYAKELKEQRDAKERARKYNLLKRNYSKKINKAYKSIIPPTIILALSIPSALSEQIGLISNMLRSNHINPDQVSFVGIAVSVSAITNYILTLFNERMLKKEILSRIKKIH